MWEAFSATQEWKSKNVYFSGEIIGTEDYLGGVVGYKGGAEIYSAYYNQETSGQNDTGKGEPRTTAELTYVPSDDTYQTGISEESGR